MNADLLVRGRRNSHTDRGSLPFCHFQLTARKPSSLPYPAQLNTLGDHLRKRQLDLGLLQREVAEKLGVTDSTIWNWEANYSSPQLRIIPKVIAFLGYEPYSTASGSFGERLLACRRSMGLSQKELADRMGIDPSTLGKWERGGRPPSKKVMARVRAFLAAAQKIET